MKLEVGDYLTKIGARGAVLFFHVVGFSDRDYLDKRVEYVDIKLDSYRGDFCASDNYIGVRVGHLGSPYSSWRKLSPIEILALQV